MLKDKETPTPKWHKLMYETPGDVSGEILATLTMVPEAKKDSLAKASLIPETIDASVEVTVVGLTREPYHPSPSPSPSPNPVTLTLTLTLTRCVGQQHYTSATNTCEPPQCQP